MLRKTLTEVAQATIADARAGLDAHAVRIERQLDEVAVLLALTLVTCAALAAFAIVYAATQ